MKKHRLSVRTLMVAVALTLVATSCSGSDVDVADDPANAPITQIDEGSGGVASGPIAGLLTVQPSFGFGVFDVNGGTGQAAAVPGIASVESVYRDTDFIVSDDVAYALGFTPREGQSFANDISVVKVDYATGQVSQLVALGFDRETDDSPSTINYSIEAVAGDRVVVSTASDDGPVFTVYDANSGDEKASFDRPIYELNTDAGSCTGTIDNVIGLSDGRVAGSSLGSPALIDLDDGELELLIDCDEETPELGGFVDPTQISDYVVFNEGPAPTEEQIARLLMSDLESDWGFVEGDGDLWWINAESQFIDGIDAIVGGVVQFDLDTESVEKVHPLGVHLGEYTDCGADSAVCNLRTLEQARLRFFDGRLLILDGGENGKLLTLDPATSDLRVTELERDGVDYTTADLLSGDPGAVWLEVRRMTIIGEDEGSRTAAGPSYLERLDPSTGQINLSLAADDLFS